MSQRQTEIKRPNLEFIYSTTPKSRTWIVTDTYLESVLTYVQELEQVIRQLPKLHPDEYPMGWSRTEADAYTTLLSITDKVEE